MQTQRPSLPCLRGSHEFVCCPLLVDCSRRYFHARQISQSLSISSETLLKRATALVHRHVIVVVLQRRTIGRFQVVSSNASSNAMMNRKVHKVSLFPVADPEGCMHPNELLPSGSSIVRVERFSYGLWATTMKRIPQHRPHFDTTNRATLINGPP